MIDLASQTRDTSMASELPEEPVAEACSEDIGEVLRRMDDGAREG